MIKEVFVPTNNDRPKKDNFGQDGNYIFDKSKPIKVDLASGINYYKGTNNDEINEWVHCDIDDEEHVEIVCDFSDGIPIESGVVDFAHNTEFIEHLPKFKEEKIMREFNRILKIGGLLFGTTPSLMHTVRGLSEGSMDYHTAMQNMYGDQFDYQHCHYRLFTEQSLIDFFKKWGFDEVDLSKSPGYPNEFWFVFYATKTRNV